MVVQTPYNALTPRSRQEIEPNALLRTRRLFPVINLSAGAVVVESRAAQMVEIERLWAANTGATSATYSLHVLTGTETASAANAIALGVAVPANTTVEIVGGSGLILFPNQRLHGVGGGAINVFGRGWDVMGTSGT